MSLFWLVVGSCAVPVVVLMVMYMTKPGLVLYAFMRMNLYRSGLRRKKFTVGGMTYSCAEKGRPSSGKPTMLLIHGYSATMESWATLVQHLPDDVHVIAVDLLGHGGTSAPPEGEDLGFHDLARGVHQIVKLLRLEKQRIHVIGQSLGGSVAGCYAASYPVSHVTFMCPAFATPEMSVMNRMEKEGTLNQFADDLDEFYSSMSMVFNNIDVMPKQFVKGMLQMRNWKLDFYKRLMKYLTADIDSDTLPKAAKSVTAPSQIIWGTNDKVVHVSGAKVLKEALPNCVKVHLLDDSSHMIFETDKEKEQVAKFLMNLQSQWPKNEK